MPRITELKALRRGGPLRLYLDGTFAFTIDENLARQHGLRVGLNVDIARVEGIRRAALRAEVAEAGWRLLAIRPRAREELRRRLLRKGLPEREIEEQLDHLQELGYLDDAEFARAWVDMRRSGGTPRGATALRAELRQKGVDAKLAREVTESGDEGAAALAAAQTRAAALRALPFPEFRRRLYGYLQRRGFDYETARTAVRAVWEAREGGEEVDGA